MRLLVVAATHFEIAPFLGALAINHLHGGMTSGDIGSHQVDLLLTGVGMVATAAHCSRVLAAGRHDGAINLGVCGSFTDRLPHGTVVHVTSELISELGVEDGSQFLTLDEVGLAQRDLFPLTNGRLENSRPIDLPGLVDLPVASGITVNTVHGSEASIADVVRRCAPEVESMEGAGFMYACLISGIPFAEVRAVSNRVERRNRAAWDLPGAVAALGRTTLTLLEG